MEVRFDQAKHVMRQVLPTRKTLIVIKQLDLILNFIQHPNQRLEPADVRPEGPAALVDLTVRLQVNTSHQFTSVNEPVTGVVLGGFFA